MAVYGRNYAVLTEGTSDGTSAADGSPRSHQQTRWDGRIRKIVELHEMEELMMEVRAACSLSEDERQDWR